MITEAKIAWLAGIIDGEGSIGIYPVTRRSTKQGFVLIKQLEIANDNTVIIQECVDIIHEITGRQARLTYSKRDNRKFIHYAVSVNKIADLVKVLKAVEPYLIGKKSQAQIVINFFTHRIKGTKYTKLELEVSEILKQAKNDNKSLVDGNTEPSRDIKPSQACVETIQAQLL